MYCLGRYGKGVVSVDGTEWWDTAAVADHLGVELDTVAAYRSRGQMPEPTLFGRTPMWRRDVIEEWQASRRPRNREG